MKTKHTPGPLIIHALEFGYRYETKTPGDYEPVCDLVNVGTNVKDELFANARLKARTVIAKAKGE